MSLTSNHQELKSSEQRVYSFMPKNFEDAVKCADLIAKSDLAPRDFKGKPGNVFIAMQMGAELGVSPMQAIQNIAVVNGRPAVWGDLLLAIVQSHPHYQDHEEYIEGEGNNMKAVCIVTRKGRKPKRAEFSVADAIKAQLWSKAGSWTTHPKRMLQMRARAFALRDSFADALRGLSMVEEVMDYEPEEKNITPAAPAEPAKDAKTLMLEKIEASETEEQLKETYKEAYHHAQFTKDAEFKKKATELKDRKKFQLELGANEETKGEENHAAIQDQE